MDYVRPALDGASVAGVVPALLGAADDSFLPTPARSGGPLVLLVLDGLGWHALQEHAAAMPVLSGMGGGPVTTVVPSTTSTALTSIVTGLAPGQHGIVGYRMLVGGDVLNVLRWTVSDGERPPDPFDVQRHAPFLGREVPVVTKGEFRSTGFTQAHLRGVPFAGWYTTAALVEQCVRSVESGARLVYAYYPGVDTVAHEYGLRDRVYARELAFADRLVGDLLEALPAGTTLLVTSDHGQVHLEAASWRHLPEVAPYVAHQAGDARFRYLYAKPGAQRSLLDAARDAAGDVAWVRSRRELLDEGWVGPTSPGSVPGRLGDVVLAAHGGVAFVDPTYPNEAKLRSGHGSLTADEMLVPLLAAPATG